MKPCGISITLDHPRTLLLDRTALRLFRYAVGIREDELLAMEMNLERVQQLLCVGLHHESPRLTYQKVCLLVTHRNYTQFLSPIAQAIVQSCSPPPPGRRSHHE